jgi:hypothetical protein
VPVREPMEILQKKIHEAFGKMDGTSSQGILKVIESEHLSIDLYWRRKKHLYLDIGSTQEHLQSQSIVKTSL